MINVVVMCNDTKCLTADKFKMHDQYFGVVDSPSQRKMIIQFFDPITDAGEWKCMDSWLYGASCEKIVAATAEGKDASAEGNDGASVHVASTYMVIFWTVAGLTANLQRTISFFFN
ncbi:uncharacterized protein LOC121386418 [Gigantopelta aegis]|uniref:uncharacterized protein LOC121386418 n=1 Tax=Gigantopelta aegis TaxID=1735272 RepID=UPI001B889757|nr:uncharacterized protein LOC121386418 [Gigantopelta aegis]